MISVIYSAPELLIKLGPLYHTARTIGPLFLGSIVDYMQFYTPASEYNVKNIVLSVWLRDNCIILVDFMVILL